MPRPAQVFRRVLVRSAALALPAALLLPPASAMAGAWIPERGESVSQITASTFAATSFYDANGTRTTLPGEGARWQERDAVAVQESGWIHHTSLRYRLPLVSATERSGGASYTSTGFSDLSLGLRYGLLRAATPVTLSLDWTLPLGYNRTLSLIGEGLQQVTGSLDAGSAIGTRALVQGSIGWGQRFLSISRKTGAAGTEASEPSRRWADIVTMAADAGMWLRPRLMVGGRYQGIVTTTTGDGEPKRKLQLAGPFLLLRVDDHLDVQAGSWSGFSGRYEVAPDGSAPVPPALHYDQVYVAAIFRQARSNRLQGTLGVTRQP